MTSEELILITVFEIQTTAETLAFMNAQRLANKPNSKRKDERKW